MQSPVVVSGFELSTIWHILLYAKYYVAGNDGDKWDAETDGACFKVVNEWVVCDMNYSRWWRCVWHSLTISRAWRDNLSVFYPRSPHERLLRSINVILKSYTWRALIKHMSDDTKYYANESVKYKLFIRAPFLYYSPKNFLMKCT